MYFEKHTTYKKKRQDNKRCNRPKQTIGFFFVFSSYSQTPKHSTNVVLNKFPTPSLLDH